MAYNLITKKASLLCRESNLMGDKERYITSICNFTTTNNNLAFSQIHVQLHSSREQFYDSGRQLHYNNKQLYDNGRQVAKMTNLLCDEATSHDEMVVVILIFFRRWPNLLRGTSGLTKIELV
jgi:hypothetical protein